MSDSTPTKTLSKPIGSPGLKQWGGILADEWDRNLQGRRGPETYRQMADADPTVGAVLFGIESLIRGAGHRLEPADESTQAEELSTFVEQALDDMQGPFGGTLADALTCIPFGFSLMEVVYKIRNGPTLDGTSSKYDDGKIGWARWAIRAQETIQRWEFDDAQEPTAAEQWAPPNYQKVLIPLDKCLLFRVRARKNSPEGLSMLRNVYEPYYFRKHLMRIEAIGAERDLAGLPMAMIPIEVINAQGSEFNSYVEIVTNVRRDEQSGFVWPSDRDETGNLLYEFKLLSTGGTRQIDTDTIIARYERYILRALMADFMTLGDVGVGSHAQARSRIDLFVTGLKAIMDGIADVINTQAIRRLMALNNMPLELAPMFVFNDVTQEDTSALAASLATLISAGLVDATDPDLRQHVYDVFGLPAPAQTVEQADAEEGGQPPDQTQQEGAGATQDGQTPPNTPPNGKTPPTPPQKGQPMMQASEWPVEFTPERQKQIDDAVAAYKRWAPKYKDLLNAEVEG